MRNDRGQATLEVAFTLPVVLIALLLIVQVGIVVRDALALAQSAREGARAAALHADDDPARTAVRSAGGPPDADRIEIEITPRGPDRRIGEPVTVALEYEERLRIPIVSRILTADLP